MKFTRFLASQAPLLAIFSAIIALAAFMLFAAGVAAGVIVLVALLEVVGVLVALWADWMRKRRFFSDLDACAHEVDHPLWMTEMVDRPDYLEGQITYDALDAIAHAANDDVAGYRRQVADYREYIETWVHEAKSPLAAAHLMIDNLRAEPLAAGAASKVRSLDDELRRVEGYIDQALFYARSEALDRDYLIRTYNLGSLVAGALRANASVLIGAHVAPVLGDLDFEIFTDEKWLEFILGQIIQNSVKYACAEQPRIEFSAELVDAGGARERVELTVSDNGCGVSASDLPRVFDKGFTGDNGRTGKRSTGIGLYLVKRLCDKMGVGVSAASRAGEGFAITLTFSRNKFQYVDRGGRPSSAVADAAAEPGAATPQSHPAC